MNRRLTCLAVSTAFVLPAVLQSTALAAPDFGTNIAINTNSATPIMGYNTADDGSYGTDYANGAPGVVIVNDGTIASGIAAGEDTFNGAKGQNFYDFVGVIWSTTQNNVSAVRLYHSTFNDGGWFDYPGLTGSVDQDFGTPISIQPRVQYTTDGGATWLEVTGSSDDYSTAIPNVTGVGAYALRDPATFTFDPVSGINGIRIIGDGYMHDSSTQPGFIGVSEFQAFAEVPEPASLALLACAGLTALVRRRG